MSSSDVEDLGEDYQTEESGQLAFVLILKKYKVLLDKSQTPEVKSKKKAAATKMCAELLSRNGQDLDPKRLFKKINNMKTTIKTKSDRNATGNRKIILQHWEKEFLELLQPDNPTIGRVPGAFTIGSNPMEVVPNLSPPHTAADPSPTNHALLPSGPKRSGPPPPPPSNPKQGKFAEPLLADHETEETKNLSTSQLQRLVLLEQLKLIRLKIAKHQRGQLDEEVD